MPIAAFAIRTGRLVLRPSTPALAEAEASNLNGFYYALGVQPPDSWPPELHDAQSIAFNRDQLRDHPEQIGWWAWYFLVEHEGNRFLAGVGGFKGMPDAEGAVELGYSILPDWRGMGLATEAVLGLCAWAGAQPGVTRVSAHTLEGMTASRGVLRKAGFSGPHSTGRQENGTDVLRFERPLNPDPTG